MGVHSYYTNTSLRSFLVYILYIEAVIHREKSVPKKNGNIRKRESHENDLGWKMVQVCQKENGLGFQNNENIDRKMVQVFKIFKI